MSNPVEETVEETVEEVVETVENVARKCFDWRENTVVNILVLLFLLSCIGGFVYLSFDSVKNRKKERKTIKTKDKYGNTHERLENPWYINIIAYICCIITFIYLSYLFSCDKTTEKTIRESALENVGAILICCCLMICFTALEDGLSKF